MKGRNVGGMQSTCDFPKAIVAAMIITSMGHAMRLKNDSSSWRRAFASDRLCSKDASLCNTEQCRIATQDFR